MTFNSSNKQQNTTKKRSNKVHELTWRRKWKTKKSNGGEKVRWNGVEMCWRWWGEGGVKGGERFFKKGVNVNIVLKIDAIVLLLESVCSIAKKHLFHHQTTLSWQPSSCIFFKTKHGNQSCTGFRIVVEIVSVYHHRKHLYAIIGKWLHHCIWCSAIIRLLYHHALVIKSFNLTPPLSIFFILSVSKGGRNKCNTWVTT